VPAVLFLQAIFARWALCSGFARCLVVSKKQASDRAEKNPLEAGFSGATSGNRVTEAIT
jgi:hypothetical protein